MIPRLDIVRWGSEVIDQYARQSALRFEVGLLLDVLIDELTRPHVDVDFCIEIRDEIEFVARGRTNQ